MPPVGFEPTISAGERPQTHALDRAVTGTGYLQCSNHIKSLPSQLNSQICEEQIFSLSRLSVRMEQLGSHWTSFPETSDFKYFSKICSENSNFINTGQE